MYPDFQDKTLECKDCKAPFVLEAGEQDFLYRLEQEGKKDRDGNPAKYTEPKRCRGCRKYRRDNHIYGSV